MGMLPDRNQLSIDLNLRALVSLDAFKVKLNYFVPGGQVNLTVDVFAELY